MKKLSLKRIAELGGLSGNASSNHPGMTDDNENDSAKRLRDILSKNENKNMKTFKQIIAEIDDQVPAEVPDQGAENPAAQNMLQAPGEQYLPQYQTTHALDSKIQGMMAQIDIQPDDWNRPDSDTYQKYQAFIQALWKEVEFKRGGGQ